jgi:hypothetical protein
MQKGPRALARRAFAAKWTSRARRDNARGLSWLLKVIGTETNKQIDVIKNNTHKVNPNQKEAALEYVDNSAAVGERYYYVRVEQTDGQLAWRLADLDATEVGDAMNGHRRLWRLSLPVQC